MGAFELQTHNIIAAMNLTLMGNIARSYLEDRYEGAVQVITLQGESIAILPNVQEGFKVAEFAIGDKGGYGSVNIYPAHHGEITHDSFIEWLD